MKILPILSAVILSLTPTSATLADPIRIALPSWDSGKYVAYDLGHRIETELKRDNSFVPIEVDPMWVELDIASRTIIGPLIEQFRMRLVPLLHGLHGRFALQR